MSQKPILMIHEVREWMFNLPLENYVLTFDDGLYSQFYYNDRFKQYNTQRIYFISSGIISSSTQSTKFPVCRDAHVKAREGNFEDYMSIEQIKELMQDPNVTIGGHSHLHIDLRQMVKLFDKVKHIESDTVSMIAWFQETLGFKPTSFCFPYNYNLDTMYSGLLKKYGFTEFYGRERISVESLLQTEIRTDCLYT